MTNRRDFLKASAAAGAVSSVPYFASTQKAFANDAANDRPVIGCIGLGGMGRGDLGGHRQFGDVVALCDVDTQQIARAKERNEGKGDEYTDYREVLDRDDIDVISCVTTDHWHTKICIEALEAGKHVFCQKPLTLTLEENQLIRNACDKHKDKVFFVGTQQRSDGNKFLRAVNMVQKGLLGDIKKVTVGINGGSVGGPFKTTTPPDSLDWDFWLGQAPKVDYIPQRCHGTFRWWYEYSGGKFTDWGAHHIDISLWALKQNDAGTGPVSFDGSDAHHPVPYQDGYPTVDDCYNTANDFAIPCKFADGVEMVVDSRSDNGILFEGSKGRIFVSRGKITGTPIEEGWDKGKFDQDDLSALYKGKPFEGHKNNFYRCIREGGLPVSDVYSHLQTMNSCHLAAIAARLGREIKWDPKAEKIVGDEQAAAMFAREQRKGFEIPRV
ncbi:Gfo/Idh/MocA family protein [Novipirellula artificiosorum]|uniref:Inositol 2-dehydrogenase n=1 Tax=Novipirellula artificiosorum TaxID=2528016 RepID=A0A5C6DQE0_9BACT|nr:Gfo/Idh/MocA family oxidoreductase [Novipirellula artificiosorum]TWU37236.1 Inositol 2-dehydrogenase [Novipirellula artificiosorum]